MHTSHSQINQSIYESKTNPITIQESRKGNPKALVNENEKPFIHYYEENIKLKKKQDDMAREMMSLKKRLNEQDQMNKRKRQQELKMLATGKKSLWDTKNRTMYTGHKNQRMASGQKADTHKVQNLLQIIDHYKTKMITAEEEIQNLKRQKYLLEQDGKVKQKKADQLMKTFQQSSGKKNQYQSLQQQLRSTINHLQIEKNRNKFNEAEIKRLQSRIKSMSINESQLEDLRAMNRNLQDKILRLTTLPSFGSVTEKADEEHKIKELERKYKGVSEKYNQLRTESLKTQAEVKLLKNKLIEVHSEADQLEKQNAALKKESIDNPVLSKLANNPDLLAKVVYEIEYSGKRESSKLDSQLQKQSYERILLEKQMLAKELGIMRAQMDAMRENWKEKQRMIKMEKDQLLNVYKDQQNILAKTQGRTTSKSGVPYTDDVSMFSQDTGNVPANCNYFDIFLGDLHLLQTMMKTIFNIHNAETSLIMGTVDFYNHNTENTKPVHGAHSNLQSQFSFKVTEDQFFFKYLNKGQFYIDIWGSEGNKRHHFGRAVVDLKPIVIKSRKNVAPVVSSSAPVYLNHKVMGSINVVMRMRLPIYDQLQKVSQINQTLSPDQQAPTRRLIIQIQQGKGFGQKSNTFVYYPFRLQDYYTKTYRGSNPVWNHHKSLQLKYNTDLKNYLRKNELELIVLDDNIINTNVDDGSDLVGNAYVSLLPLLENKMIKERVQVVKGAQKIGFIDVKIFWHDVEDGSLQKISTAKQLEEKEEQLNQIQDDISKFMRENRVEPEDIFKMIDRNRSDMISFNEFEGWVSKISPNSKISAINQFYNSFKQPVNSLNFTARINQRQNIKSQIAMELGMINKLMNQNTNLIQQKQSLKEFLKGKDIIQISLDIDKSRNGKISKNELQEYFDEHNIEEDIKWHQNQIELISFLKKYQHFA